MKLAIAAFHSLAHDISGAAVPAPMLPALRREEIAVGETSRPLPPNTAFIEIRATDDCIVVVTVSDHISDELQLDGGEKAFFGVQPGWTVTLKESL